MEFPDSSSSSYNNNNNNKKKEKKEKNKELLKVFKNPHEGFAVDWCPTSRGLLASGSLDGRICLYEPKDNLSDLLRQENFYTYHQDSVEDV